MTKTAACIALCALVLFGCTRENAVRLSTPPAGAAITTVFVASQQSPTEAGAVFARDRIARPSFAQVDVAIPPDYMPGNDLDGYVMTRHHSQDARAFIAALAAQPGDDIVLYLHGFNTTSTEAVMRLAQMGHDFGRADGLALFSWASAAAPGAYVYDRDSVLFGRDAFVQFVAAFAAQTDKDITLVAHSMGAQLALEGMRQLALTGDDRTLSAITSVVLLSPDIDPDIFRSQVDAIGPRPAPFVIVTSGTDRVLRLSSVLIGGRAKVGQLRSQNDVRGLDVVFIDLTAVSTGQQFGHLEAATSPSAIALLRDLANSGDVANHPLLLE